MTGAPPCPLVAKRRQLVYEILTHFPAVTLQGIADMFGVDRETIKHDASMLRDWGYLDKRPPGRKPRQKPGFVMSDEHRL